MSSWNHKDLYPLNLTKAIDRSPKNLCSWVGGWVGGWDSCIQTKKEYANQKEHFKRSKKEDNKIFPILQICLFLNLILMPENPSAYRQMYFAISLILVTRSKPEKRWNTQKGEKN